MIWAAGLILSFGTLFWALGFPQSEHRSWVDQLYFSGVTFFTLGYGDIVPHTALTKMLAVVQAGIGLGFIATVIGYLPVLYQLFSRREAQVILLDAAAGSPPCALDPGTSGASALDRRHGGAFARTDVWLFSDLGSGGGVAHHFRKLGEGDRFDCLGRWSGGHDRQFSIPIPGRP